jgi:hypothetical protein
MQVGRTSRHFAVLQDLVAIGAWRTSGACHQNGSQHAIAGAGNDPEPILAGRRVILWRQAKPRSKVPCRLESARIHNLD